MLGVLDDHHAGGDHRLDRRGDERLTARASLDDHRALGLGDEGRGRGLTRLLAERVENASC